MRKLKPDYLFVLIWSFRKEVIKQEEKYIKNGGKLIFHLPKFHIIDLKKERPNKNKWISPHVINEVKKYAKYQNYPINLRGLSLSHFRYPEFAYEQGNNGRHQDNLILLFYGEGLYLIPFLL